MRKPIPSINNITKFVIGIFVGAFLLATIGMDALQILINGTTLQNASSETQAVVDILPVFLGIAFLLYILRLADVI